ncbi:MAG: hypothetical protein U0805_07650 [Pirellulales bacterium]
MYARTILNLAAATLVALFLALSARGQSLPVPKTNPFPVYMHYMPWFQTPTSQGGTGGSQWGWHWKMNTQNPNVVDASGKRQIASYYYPKIGPYDSSDPNVIEYHSLLMKYSGIDGVLIDWYGVQGSNGDINSLLAASNAFVNRSNMYGLGFGVVLEDRFARNLADEQANMRYLRDNYFNKSNSIKYGASQNPLMLNFGPITFQTPADWAQILPATGADPEFLTLLYQSSEAGANADGEYAWPYQDANTSNHLNKLRSFYQTRAPSLKTVGGVAYPGFHDFYQPGGAGSTLFYIPENNGQTLTEVLNLNTLFQPNLDMLQLATFNDYGEGTMFEPTVETGFNYLHQIQLYTGVSYGTDELELIYELYLARKKYAADAGRQSQLDQVVSYLAILQVDDARSLLSQVSPAGDFNADGSVTVADYNMWRAAFGKSTIIYGSGADGNFDGVIDARDYLVWRDAMAAAGNGALADAMAPEAGVGSLITVAVGAMSWFRARR